MEKEFNLLHEPWILVMQPDGQTEEVSMLDIFRNAHKWRGLAGELPTQDVAVLRLLLAVLHAVFARQDAHGNYAPLDSPVEALQRWSSLWERGEFPHEIITEYLKRYQDRFWLFHPTQPFYQVVTLTEATDYTAAKLNGELSQSGNKIRLFPKRTGVGKGQLDYAESARWLLYVNAFDDTSSKPKSKGLPSPGAGWLGKLGLITAAGDNLFQTLLLNLVLLKDGEDELWGAEQPMWEVDVRRSERTEITMPDNPSALLTIQSRRMLLKRQENSVVGFALLGGDFFARTNAFAEQMTIWRLPGKGNVEMPEHSPKRHDASRQLWRDFPGLIAQREGGRRPGIVSWLARLKREGLITQTHFRFETAAVKYGDKDFFVDDVFSDSIALNTGLLVDLGQCWVERIADELELTEKLVQKVGDLAQKIAKASGETSSNGTRQDVKEQAYFRLDRPFRSWLEAVRPESDDIDEQCTKWWITAQQIIRSLGRELVERAGLQSFSGRRLREGELFHLYTTPEAFNRFLYAISSRETLRGGKQL